MKTRIYSSLLAVLLLNLCVNLTYAQDEKVYDYKSITTPPVYPGGMHKFYELLVNTMKYPSIAAENNIQGTTNVSFIIEKDGSLTDVKINGPKLGYGLEEEAVRSIKLTKKWTPALLNGTPVKVKYNVPVKFALPKSPKKVGPITTTPATTANATNEGDKTIYSHASIETPPTYPGGIAKFYEFLGQNISYPKAAIANKTQGTVKVSFTIEKDGSITDVKSQNQLLGSGTDEEAIRVMTLSKRWNPGLQDGKPVRVSYQLPIKFTMKK